MFLGVVQFAEFCGRESNLKCVELEATHAFHSKHMDPILDDFRKVAGTVKTLGGNDCEYISGMRGSIVEADEIGVEFWIDHTREGVLFMEACKKAVDLGCKTFIEVEPQPFLGNFETVLLEMHKQWSFQREDE